MKIFFITTLDVRKPGGLYNATFERIKRHSNYYSTEIINQNTYPSVSIKTVLRMIGKKFEHDKKLNEEIILDGLRVRNSNIRLSMIYYLKRLIKKTSIENVAANYYKKFSNELNESDIIHAHWGFPHGYIAYLLSEKYNIPYFITFHGTDINKLQGIDQNKLLIAMENAKKCFFVSNSLLKIAIKKGYSGRNAIVTYNGVDRSKFNLKTTNEKSKVIAYVGALKNIKGADLLPKIFGEINKLDSSINFKIIGDGPLKSEILEELKKNNLLSRVEFAGNVKPDMVPRCLEEVSVLVVPSRMEGLGMVILEANAMGIPAVGSDVGGIPEAVGVSDNVFSINNNFPTKVAKRVIELINDPNYNLNAIKLSNRISMNFTWEEICKLERKAYEAAKL